MKRFARAAAATFLTAAALTALPATAHAVSAVGTDPTGDVAAGATFDIVSLGVDLTPTTVQVTVKFAAAMPAFSDPSWGSFDSDEGRLLFISLGEDIGHPGFWVDREGATAIPSFYRLDSGLCGDATANVAGDTITMSAPSSCFNKPGKIEAQAAVQDGLEADIDEIDIAIAPQLSLLTEESDLTTVDVSLPGGYYGLAADGGIFAFGDASFHGSTGNITLNKPVVAMAAQPGGGGYRFVASDGGVFAYGSAGFFGSMGGKPLNKPIVGMASTPSGNGYWLVASDGGIFAYGDAKFVGSAGSLTLNLPIVGMAPTPSGNGYWLVASDGGIFAYGDAKFLGSTGGMKLNSPIIGMAPTATGNGYWLAARDGGIFAYGDATFQGSGTNYFDDNVVAIGRSNVDGGYYLAADDGEIVNYGSALDFGDTYRLDIELNQPLVGLAVKP